MKNQLVRAFLVTGLVAVTSFLFQVLSARNLPLEDFSRLSSVIAYLNVFGITLSGFQNEAVRLRALSPISEEKPVFGRFTRGIFIFISCVCLAFVLANSVFLPGFFSEAIVVIICGLMISAGFSTIVSIYFQSNGLFFQQTLWTLVIVTTNLIAQFFFVKFLSTSLETTLLITLISNGIVGVALFNLHGRKVSVDKFPHDGSTLKSVAFVAFFWAITNIDLILAPFVLPTEGRGEYSLAASLSRNILILLNVIFMATFSRLSNAHGNPETQLSLTNKYLWRVGILGSLGAIGLSLIAPLLVKVLYGNNHSIAVYLLPTLALATLPLVFSSVLFQFALLRKRKGTLVAIVSLLFAATCLALYIPLSPIEFSLAFNAVGATLLVILTFDYVLTRSEIRKMRTI